MQRQELEKLGWTTRGLSYLEKRLQSCEDEARRQDSYRSVFVFASPLFEGLHDAKAHTVKVDAPLSHATGFIGNL